MTADPSYVIVQTTVESAEQAADLATRIVEERLAACVQQWPIQSTYRWKGSIELAAEHLLAAKTLASRVDELMALIRESHTYDVPEILVTPVIDGAASYLDWINAAASPDG